MSIAQQFLKIRNNSLFLFLLVSTFWSCNNSGQKIRFDIDKFRSWNDLSINSIKECASKVDNRLLMMSMVRMIKNDVRAKVLGLHELKENNKVEVFERITKGRFNYVTVYKDDQVYTYEINVIDKQEIKLITLGNNNYVDVGTLKKIRDLCKTKPKLSCEELYRFDIYLNLYTEIIIGKDELLIEKFCLR